jgi:hypothetical protein
VLGSGEFWIQSPYTTHSFDISNYGPVYREQMVDLRAPLLTTRHERGDHLPLGHSGGEAAGRTTAP